MQISYFRSLCISNFVANFIEILLVWHSYDVSSYKVLQNREKDEIDEVSVLNYTENEYTYKYTESTRK